VNLPHYGYLGEIDYLGNRQSLGATDSYDRFQAGFLGVQTIDRWTGLARVIGGDSFGTNIPFYDEFQLGGLFRLSGRPNGQLRGDTFALASFLLYYRLTATGGAILKNVSLGVSIETGNVWPNHDSVHGLLTAGSVFLVADTIVGPLFVGYGHSGGNSSAYLFLNRSF
jgi:NTE family protein